MDDPGVLDTHTVTVDWGDGSAARTVSLAAGVLACDAGVHQYLASGTYTVRVRVTVTDKDGGQAVTTNLVQVK